MSIPTKSCLFCEHITHTPAFDYSDVTHQGQELRCDLGHFQTFPPEDNLISELRIYVIKAEDCPDYKPCQ